MSGSGVGWNEHVFQRCRVRTMGEVVCVASFGEGLVGAFKSR